MPNPAAVEPRRRDPEARRRAIIAAAAEILIAQGTRALTHRAVAARAQVAVGSTTKYFESLDTLKDAALTHIADDIDGELDLLAARLRDAPPTARHLAVAAHEFLADPHQVRSSMALLSAAVTDDEVKALALRWADRFTAMLARHLDPARATAIQVYLDGATAHAALHETPLTRRHLETVFTLILAGATPSTEPQP